MASYGPLQNTENEENPPVTMVVTLDNAPGSLANLLDVLRERGVNMSRIRSRPSATSPDEYEIELDLVTDSLTSDDIEDLKTSLPGRKVQVAYQENVPWFPREEQDLDGFAVKTLDYGGELDADHPGFQDEEYRKRRAMIVENARTFRHGDALPRVEYTEEEIATWTTIWDKLTELYPTHACKQYNQIFPLMMAQAGFSRTSIPQLEDVSAFLQSCTGFSLRPVQGLLSPRDFLNGLAFRVFHSTQYIRHHSRPEYTPEPDVCHELLGHVPLLADPDFAAFSQEIGLASLGASDEDIKRLSTLYWHTVEFGIVQEDDGPKAYGAGLLSSIGELQYCVSDVPEVRPFSVEDASQQEYPITEYQPVYFLAQSFRSMTEDLRFWSSRLDRPFAVHYDPFCRRVEVLDTRQRVMSVMTNISSELSVLSRALELLL